MSNPQKIICPSSRCKEGAQLIGVRQDDGSVAILPQPLPVDRDFIENAKRIDEAPEQRFRFANKCVEGGCVQWTGKSCRIAEEIVLHLDEISPAKNLRPCFIRPQCRWFMQSGANACQMCKYVITEITEMELASRTIPTSTT
jgi:hypothetical protein